MSVSKFKVGDKVKVRKGLVVDEYYDGVRCSGPMPVEKTLDNLCAGDFIRCGHIMGKVLVAINGCYLLSKDGLYDVADGWYTAEQLKMDGFEFFDLQVKTIEINGKKYKKADVEEAIKGLEPIK